MIVVTAVSRHRCGLIVFFSICLFSMTASTALKVTRSAGGQSQEVSGKNSGLLSYSNCCFRAVLLDLGSSITRSLTVILLPQVHDI